MEKQAEEAKECEDAAIVKKTTGESKEEDPIDLVLPVRVLFLILCDLRSQRDYYSCVCYTTGVTLHLNGPHSLISES